MWLKARLAIESLCPSPKPGMFRKGLSLARQPCADERLQRLQGMWVDQKGAEYRVDRRHVHKSTNGEDTCFREYLRFDEQSNTVA